MPVLHRDVPVLVTGASGVLGTAVLQILAGEGFTRVLAPARDELNLLDAANTAAYLRTHNPRIVIHLASVVYGLGGNQEFQMRCLVENTAIHNNFLGALAVCPPEQVFFAGTVASYPYPFRSMPLREDDLFEGLCHQGEFGYAMAKRHAYAYLQLLARQTGMRFSYGVFTNLYGPNDRFNIRHGHVVPSLIAKAHASATTGAPFEVWGDGSAERDFLHAHDAARAILLCLQSGQDGLVANISSGESVSIARIASVIARTAGLSDPVFLPDKPVGVVRRVMDTSRLAAFGFSPALALEQGLEQTYAWYARNLGRVRQ